MTEKILLEKTRQTPKARATWRLIWRRSSSPAWKRYLRYMRIIKSTCAIERSCGMPTSLTETCFVRTGSRNNKLNLLRLSRLLQVRSKALNPKEKPTTSQPLMPFNITSTKHTKYLPQFSNADAVGANTHRT